MQSDAVVVLLFGSRVTTGQAGTLTSERPDLAAILGEGTTVAELGFVRFGPLGARPDESAQRVTLDAANLSTVDRLLRRIGAFALYGRLSHFPIGRLLNSLGPVDPGRVFWRSVRRSPEARSAIAAADAVIAGDGAAIKTAWIVRHRRWVGRAVYDHRAASLLANER